MQTFANDLNEAQVQAVTHGDGPLLIVAGAGSGKTRVLTRRIAWLVAERGVPPSSILAFTFTNKAAREMRERVLALVGEAAAKELWVGTFHATCARLLRREAGRAGLPQAFTIFDRDDQTTLLKQVMRAGDSTSDELKPGLILSRISGAKNAFVDPEGYFRSAVTDVERKIARIYEDYETGLERAGAVDFDDLIVRSVKLLEGDADVRARYAGRFRHVLVDEYQDTNHAQFRLVTSFSSVHGNVTAVGDDDQSIYGWRGADLSNVLDFERHFPRAVIIRLEQNYRSTGNILKAASGVIARNRARKGKTLWTTRDEGSPLRLVLSADEQSEGERLAREVRRQVAAGRKLSDVAILFRTNAQSRALELAFRGAGLAYDLVGGVSFYERKEVKDVLAYLRAALNPRDSVSFLRILNVPRRGLGDRVREAIEARVATGETGAAALAHLIETGEVTGTAATRARGLLDLLGDLHARAAEPADILIEEMLQRTGYLEYLDDAHSQDAADRRENVGELVVAARQSTAGSLEGFLTEAALVADVDRWQETDERAILLTAHNAKGLEFPVVIVAGLEEGLFPHASALDDEEELEEERRLFYVALTRAEDEVILSAASFRRRWDRTGAAELSRFVREIPTDLLAVESPLPPRPGMRDGSRSAGGGWGAGRGSGSGGTSPSFPGAANPKDPSVGRRVHHEKFGRGRVLAAEGRGPDKKYTIEFQDGETRKILGRFLTGVDDGDEPA
ncbi:MAG: ATP-dependent helicase [Candidatus Eiseniibacteriota bacterium]